jgi:hypothetical protein
METRKIGSLNVTVVGIGSDNFGGRIDEEKTREVLFAALDAGITSSTPPTFTPSFRVDAVRGARNSWVGS